MSGLGGLIARGGLAMAGRRSPWGKDGTGGSEGGDQPAAPPEGAGGGDPPSDPPAAPSPPASPGPRNPWLPGAGAEPPRRSASIEDIFRPKTGGPRSGGGNGGNGGGGNGFPRLPQRPGGKSWTPLIVGGVAAIWLFVTCAHQLGSTQEGIVTTFGKYSHTIGSGVSMTMPWPIQDVQVVEVTTVRRNTIPEGEAEKLMLTSDQNLVDLSYLVRWNIKNLKLYTFQLADPENTVTEVAEAAMRASVAEVTLNSVLGGAGRAEIETKMRQRMQEVLDAYKSGVLVQGVEIKKANPPQKVVGAFEKVTAAQQDAQRDLSNAQAWAQQIIARAQGDAASFDKVYEQYRLAPDVTRRRMYYETMERVLANNDKVIVESNGVTPYLPLPEIRRRSAGAAPTAELPAPAPTAPAGGQ